MSDQFDGVPSLGAIEAEMERRRMIELLADFPGVLEALKWRNLAFRAGDEQGAYLAEQIAGGLLRVALMDTPCWWERSEWSAWTAMKKSPQPAAMRPPEKLAEQLADARKRLMRAVGTSE
jgi:hypothetical protein